MRGFVDIFSYVFISQIAAHDVVVVARVADELALEEGDVDDGGVEVDELEDEHFECQVVIELRLGAMHLCKKENHICNILLAIL